MRASRSLLRLHAGNRRVGAVWMRQILLYAGGRRSANGTAERRFHPGAAVHALRLRELRRRAAARRRRGRPVAADPLRLAGAVADDGPDRVEQRRRRSSPTSGSAIRRASTISWSSAGWSTRSRTCIPTPCASSSARRRPGCRWSGSAPAPSSLHRAGLMQGYRACVSWFHHDDFLERFDGLEPVSDQIFVVDRDRLTCSGGVSSAHLAAFIVERHLGRARAAKSLHIMIIDEAMAAEEPQPGMPLALATDDALVQQGAPRHAAVDRRAALDRRGWWRGSGSAGASSSGTSARRSAMTPLAGRPADPGRAGEAPARDHRGGRRRRSRPTPASATCRT